MNNETLAAEMKTTLRKFNRGVKDVKIEYGIFCVYVSSKRSLLGVMTDMMRTRAFRSVVPVVNNIDGGFVINAVPA